MPRRYDPAWLACVLVAAFGCLVVAATMPAWQMAFLGDLLVATWTALVVVTPGVLALRLYPEQRRVGAVHRAFRLGVTHAREVSRDR
jgi:hypothetical protein